MDNSQIRTQAVINAVIEQRDAALAVVVNLRVELALAQNDIANMSDKLKQFEALVEKMQPKNEAKEETTIPSLDGPVTSGAIN